MKVKIKLITLLLLPFITYSMKRKSSDLEINHNVPSKKICIRGGVSFESPSSTLNNTEQQLQPLTAHLNCAIPTHVINTILADTLSMYGGLICHHEQCDHTLKYHNEQEFKDHITQHATFFICRLCQAQIASFTEGQQSHCTAGTTGQHQITIPQWTSQRFKQLLKKLGLDNTSKNKKKKEESLKSYSIQSIRYSTTKLTFPTRLLKLLNHIIKKIHAQTNEYRCTHSQCSQRIKIVSYKECSGLRKHLNTKHVPLKCSSCNQVITERRPHEIAQQICPQSANGHSIAGITSEEEEKIIKDFGIEDFQCNDDQNSFKFTNNALPKKYMDQLRKITQQYLKKNSFKCPYNKNFGQCTKQARNQLTMHRHLISHIKCFKCSNCNQEFALPYLTKSKHVSTSCTDKNGHILIQNDLNKIEKEIQFLRKICQEQELLKSSIAASQTTSINTNPSQEADISNFLDDIFLSLDSLPEEM